MPACGKQAPYTIANLLFVNKLNKSILITYYLQSSIINSTGYIAQSNGLHFPWPTSFDGSPFPYDAGSPPEQWDALTDAAKWQILLFIGFLEWFSEAGGEHYMRGGKPGDFPNFSDSELIPHPSASPRRRPKHRRLRDLLRNLTMEDWLRSVSSHSFLNKSLRDPFLFLRDLSHTIVESPWLLSKFAVEV